MIIHLTRILVEISFALLKSTLEFLKFDYWHCKSTDDMNWRIHSNANLKFFFINKSKKMFGWIVYKSIMVIELVPRSQLVSFQYKWNCSIGNRNTDERVYQLIIMMSMHIICKRIYLALFMELSLSKFFSTIKKNLKRKLRNKPPTIQFLERI